MKKIGIFLGFLCLMFSGCAQKATNPEKGANPKINELVNSISEKNILQSKFVGRSTEPSSQYKAFEELMSISDEKQLIQLTDHENGVVRSYAFWALARLKSQTVSDILKKHIKDEEKIKTIFGDIMNEVSVSDFMLELVSGDDIDQNCLRLSPEQIKTFQTLKKQN